ncbi:MAG: S41 family peptidase [Crocinitomicaceae bacterium]|nr:S41 family peptidase [Crocinitomicaceae bacterium]
MKLRQLILIPLICFAAFGNAQTNTDFEIIKNLELFELVYKQVDMEYVDEPNPGHLMRVAIDAMLRELDPYTVYIPESQIEDLKLMTTGQYGGIGALIQQQDNHVVISEPYEGWPAMKSGLMAGDIFIEINDRNVEYLSSSEVSDVLMGKPGSEVKIKVKRQDQYITKTVIREEIKLKSVPYYGMIDQTTGYLKFTSFTRGASEEVLQGFLALKKSGMTKFVFDLRGNGGGLLDEAVKIVNFFVNQNETIVWMKGRKEDDITIWTAVNKPVDTEIPIVVLIDGNSASASEIVSGALQDLDRAVIVGQTSYGKGLVQRPLDLKYNAKLKITIAKYFTPSGRCIQKLDYSNRNIGQSAQNISDSLINKFKTKNGREVIDGRGIEPDLPVALPEYSRLTAMLVIEHIIFDFATQYRIHHENIAPAREFKVTDELYSEFINYVMTQNFTYTTASIELMEKLKQTAEIENYFADVTNEYNALLEKLKPSKERDLAKFKPEIKELLADEIVGRYYFQTGRIEYALVEDPFILEAVKILNDSPRYKQVLRITE